MDRHPRHGNAPRHRHHLTTRKFRNQKQPSGNRRLFLCEEICEVAAGDRRRLRCAHIFCHSIGGDAAAARPADLDAESALGRAAAPQLPDSRRRMQKPRKFASSCIGIQRCGFSWIDRRKTDVYEENHPEGWFSTLAVRGTFHCSRQTCGFGCRIRARASSRIPIRQATERG